MASDSISWKNFDGRVRDITVELVYQQRNIGKRQFSYILPNGPVSLSEYIKTTPELAQYEKGRRRALYLLED